MRTGPRRRTSALGAPVPGRTAPPAAVIRVDAPVVSRIVTSEAPATEESSTATRAGSARRAAAGSLTRGGGAPGRAGGRALRVPRLVAWPVHAIAKSSRVAGATPKASGASRHGRLRSGSIHASKRGAVPAPSSSAPASRPMASSPVAVTTRPRGVFCT